MLLLSHSTGEETKAWRVVHVIYHWLLTIEKPEEFVSHWLQRRRILLGFCFQKSFLCLLLCVGFVVVCFCLLTSHTKLTVLNLTLSSTECQTLCSTLYLYNLTYSSQKPSAVLYYSWGGWGSQKLSNLPTFTGPVEWVQIQTFITLGPVS